mmetsp:Transcript_35887/g.55092  ORF Transcript_35887/g.55092 Transcript_35887/m.55092 type:complete len:114 (-) Transcript_35887:615-956(-)|eukprot:CAMPEP_0170508354 /NCGR_PEP_ID=MMETSP0208-20121228/62066_1 /TAXON_ID=197538 /ORGANISM="Strombidium inclinatum, Strain S3" /LENGTH=113 /DNA_ID=CAMNT_0010791197 /DNA_START=1435 /DNA_END=1776 /DNA_ORIENTATION=-
MMKLSLRFIQFQNPELKRQKVKEFKVRQAKVMKDIENDIKSNPTEIDHIKQSLKKFRSKIRSNSELSTKIACRQMNLAHENRLSIDNAKPASIEEEESCSEDGEKNIDLTAIV